MAKASPMMIIGVIVVVVVLMSPQIFAGFGNLIDKGWELWEDAWEGISGTQDYEENATDASGAANIGFTMHYADGTSKEFKQEASPLNVVPLTITDTSGKEIRTIDVTTFCSLTTSSGDRDTGITTWTLDASVTITIAKDQFTSIKEIEASFSDSGTWWQNGAIKSFNKELYASEIDEAAQQYGDGTYVLIAQANVDVSVTFANGKTDSASDITTVSTLDLIYKDLEITSFTATIQTQAWS